MDDPNDTLRLSAERPSRTAPSRLNCAFCEHVLTERDRPLLGESEHTVAFEDAFPSAPGHTLVIPRRHVGKLLDLTEQESADLWRAARGQLARLSAERPGDFTIGINDGPAAGQTVGHLHLHLIPRSRGDVPDPRGGVRWVLPVTAAYWPATDQPVSTDDAS